MAVERDGHQEVNHQLGFYFLFRILIIHNFQRLWRWKRMVNWRKRWRSLRRMEQRWIQWLEELVIGDFLDCIIMTCVQKIAAISLIGINKHLYKLM